MTDARGQIQLLSRETKAESQTSACDGNTCDQTFNFPAAITNFGPADRTASSTATRGSNTASGQATANSTITLGAGNTTLRVTGSGSANGSATATPEGRSNSQPTSKSIELTFQVSGSPVTFTVTGSLSLTDSGGGIFGSTNVILSRIGQGNVFADELRTGGPGSQNINRTGTLQPGTYTLFAAATAQATVPSAGANSGSTQPSLNFDITFSPAGASDTARWTNPAGGSFQTVTNWDPAMVPGSDQTAIFNLASTYAVNVGSATTKRLEVRGGDVTFINAAYTVLSSLNAPPGLVFDNATFTLAGGQVNSVVALIGETLPARVNLGADSLWINSGGLTIGGNGHGIVAVGERGSLTSGNTLVGGGSGGGDLIVQGQNADWRGGQVNIGENGAGTLAVSGGAQARSGRAFVGSNARGAVTLDGIAPNGAISRWDLDGSLFVGVGDAGTVTVSNGGLLVATGFLIDAESSITIRGVATTVTPQAPAGLFFFERSVVDGTLLAENGGVISSVGGDLILGSTAPATMIVRGFDAASGRNSSVQSVRNLTIGESKPATLTIEGGALVSSVNGRIGAATGSDGSAVAVRGVANGSPSAWQISDGLRIGLRSAEAGNLQITDGALVHCAGLIGALVERGSVLVSGFPNTGASALKVDGSLAIGDDLNSGGELMVEAGGKVEVAGSMFIDNPADFPRPTVTVGGAGVGLGLASILRVRESLNVGRDSTVARLQILENGEVFCQNATIGVNNQAIGAVDVGLQGAGAPALFEVANDLIVGSLGRGSMTLRNGGLVTVGRQLTVGARGSVLGNGTISAPGRLVVNGGVIAPGLSPGSITLNSNFTQNAEGKLAMEVAGVNPGQFDVLHVTGDTTLGGTLEVRFIGNFLPAAGQQFDLLQLDGAVTGSFANITFPNLKAGFQSQVERVGNKFRLTALNNGIAANALRNISTRAQVGTGDNILIGGFIVRGNVPKKVIVRGIGSSLTVGGQPIAGRLADPVLELRGTGGTLIFSNDNWVDSPQREEIIASTIPPPHDSEAAIVATLPPGAYTVLLSGANGSTGIGLVEVFDIASGSSANLVNISSRGRVATGDDVMIGGLIIEGTDKVLVRAIGPSLAGAGIADPLADPALELFNSNGTPMAANDDWKSDQEAEILATTIPPANDKEAAILVTLPAGAYTAIVRGNGSSSGIALVEVFSLP
ncbi:MAG: hypothetical protein H0V56_13545 [Chthoniobacterales bacterium]|nr:hypothetical protein [Chthoniobacterales bacterium]